MNALKMIALGLLAIGFTACENDNPGFEIGVQGVLCKPQSGTYKGGTHYIGDTTEFAGHSVFINSNPNINLDDYVGQPVTIRGNYLRQQSLNVPRLVDVISVN